MENINREPGGEIRKLVWGIIPNQPFRSIQIGSKIKTKLNLKDENVYFVTRIEEDKNMFFEYGYFEYLIYVSATGKQEDQFLQSRFTKMPDQIEYFLPDGSHAEEYIV